MCVKEGGGGDSGMWPDGVSVCVRGDVGVRPDGVSVYVCVSRDVCSQMVCEGVCGCVTRQCMYVYVC